MKVLFLTMIVFSFSYSAVLAQPIFKPFRGQRELIETADFNQGESDVIKTGKRCGDYLFYEEVADQKVISFKIPVSEEERRTGVYGFRRIGLQSLKIKFEDKLKTPLVEYQAHKLKRRSTGISSRDRYILSMSAEDFRAATCLSALRR